MVLNYEPTKIGLKNNNEKRQELAAFSTEGGAKQKTTKV